MPGRILSKLVESPRTGALRRLIACRTHSASAARIAGQKTGLAKNAHKKLDVNDNLSLEAGSFFHMIGHGKRGARDVHRSPSAHRSAHGRVHPRRGAARAGTAACAQAAPGAAGALPLFNPLRLSWNPLPLAAQLARADCGLSDRRRAAHRQPAAPARAGGRRLHGRGRAGVRGLRRRQRRRAWTLSARGCAGTGGPGLRAPAKEAYPLPLGHRADPGAGRAPRGLPRPDRHRQPVAGASQRPAGADRGGAGDAEPYPACAGAGCGRAAPSALRRAGRRGGADMLQARPRSLPQRCGRAGGGAALLGGRLSGAHPRARARAGAAGVCRGCRPQRRQKFHTSFCKEVLLCLSQT